MKIRHQTKVQDFSPDMSDSRIEVWLNWWEVAGYWQRPPRAPPNVPAPTSGNTLQYLAVPCNTLQCNSLQYPEIPCSTPSHLLHQWLTDSTSLVVSAPSTRWNVVQARRQGGKEGRVNDYLLLPSLPRSRLAGAVSEKWWAVVGNWWPAASHHLRAGRPSPSAISRP